MLELARGGALSIARAIRALAVLAIVATAAAGLWSLRPIPSYSSEDVTESSPFDVTFRVTNKDAWFPLSNLKISCILAQVRALPMQPTAIDATDVRFPSRGPATLEPGESGTFTCPFRTIIGHQMKDDAAIATRAEIYFRSEYDLPLFGSFRLTNSSARFFLNTRLLPPRWVGKRQG
jgi:hypothetical protein